MLPGELGARVDPSRWTMPSVMRLLGALGGIDDVELRATFNGGIGMVLTVAPEAVDVAVATLPDAIAIGIVAPAPELGARYVEGPLQ
jgi:phosphoribosylaminoimidazole (AIR) synthetase